MQKPVPYDSPLPSPCERVSQEGAPRDCRNRRAEWLTYQAASCAARAAGITQAREYLRRHTEVPGLPSTPDLAYAGEWRGWYAFLGTTPKPLPCRKRPFTLPLGEAAHAARAAGFTTIAAYRQGYATVHGLPSNPDQHYGDWPGWPAFLGTSGKRTATFLSLDEFVSAVCGGGITGAADYGRRYRDIPALPSNPHLHYPDWPGWPFVLGRGERRVAAPAAGTVSFEAAASIARSAGWRSARQYAAGRRNHPGLPGRPQSTYRAQWPGWAAFLATESDA